VLSVGFALLLAFGLIHAKPDKGEPKKPDAPVFKPVQITADLAKDDENDPKLMQPSKKYPVKLNKDKTYLIEMTTKDFDPFLRLLDKANKELAEDDDSGGGLNSRIIYSSSTSGDHHVIASTFDGEVGKFELKVRELDIKGEAKAREFPKGGFEHAGELGENDMTDLGKRSKVISVDLKADQAYLFEIESTDFDCQLYVFDAKSRLLGQDAEKVVAAGTANGAHQLVVTTFDENVGKFTIKARAFSIKGEAKPREIAKNGLSVTDNIGQNDATDLGKLGKVFSVTLKAGQSYTIDLESATMDSYVYVFDAKSNLLARDDDSGGDLHSRVTLRAERDGVYHILATSLDGDQTGEFTLRVRKD
jgi:hypothetical protein